MKSVFTPLFAFIFCGFLSCHKTIEPKPVIEIRFSNSLKIQIRSNTGESATQLVDVTTSERYKDFKNNVEQFEISKITCLIKNYNAPDDMYFNGTLICSNEVETESYPIGSTKHINPSGLAAEGLEKEIAVSPENIDKVIAWLDSPGKFIIKSGYSLINADETPYIIDGSNSGSNFVMVVYLYVTVKTRS
jgi:hypothetical protein